MIVGQGRAGKTSLFKSLRGRDFDIFQQSTAAADVEDVKIKISEHSAFETKKGEVIMESFIPGSSTENAIACMLREGKSVEDVMESVLGSNIEEKNHVLEEKVVEPSVSEENPKRSSTDKNVESIAVENQMEPSTEIVCGLIPLLEAVKKVNFLDVKFERDKVQEKKSKPDTQERKNRTTSGNEKDNEENKIVDAVEEKKVLVRLKKKRDVGKILGFMVHDSVVVNVWDFGGQEVFYTSHCLFMVRNSIYIMAFKLSDWKKDFISKSHYVKFWLMSIQASAPGAKFFLVGTHRDVVEKEIKDKEDRQYFYEDVSMDLLELMRSAFGADRDKYLVRFISDKGQLLFYPVDNSIEDDKVTRILKENIFKALKADKYTRRKVATSWTKTCDYITTKVNENWMKVEDLSRIGKQLGVNDIQETKEMLTAFNDLGTSVYFNRPGLEDFVVINPQFLMHCVRQIIFDRKLHRKLR